MRILFFLLALCVIGSAQGQILKINKNNLNADSSNFWIGALSFNLNLNNRSVTDENENAFVGLSFTADVVYAATKHAYILINDIQYFRASDADAAFVSTGFGHFRVNWLRKKRLSFENYSQIQYDQGRNMPLRLLLGGGLRYRAVDKEKSKLILGLGAMQEKERWKQPENESVMVEKNILKNSSYINGFVQFNEHIKLDVITYYQVGYDNEDDLFRKRSAILLSHSRSATSSPFLPSSMPSSKIIR